MAVIKHQLSNQLPNYPIRILLLGTFNPEGGENVIVHYGRKKNQTWPLLSKIFLEKFNPNDERIHEKMRRFGIACIDMIQSVEVESTKLNDVTGNGYKDTELFRSNVKRNYIDLNSLVKFLEDNPNVCVFSTWGEGSSFNTEFKNIIKGIPRLQKLVSPSLAARVPLGTDKLKNMEDDWTKKIKSCYYR